SFCRIIRKDQGRIDWVEEDAQTIERKLRAFTPWPGIHCFGPDGKRLQVLELEVVDENSEPGYVQQGLIVGTRKGSLRILRLREEGKKEMDAAAFLNGHPDYYGFVFQ
ncbi:MAG: methionyl-tRNA formyltransferase, partial [SAR324 cluster bacterium]|nr:methionyl-tRNA formyltransferase [SAR324 cluster bacterium]